MMDACAHIAVTGLVQGVGFRFFVYGRATHLELTGYVRNLYDGSVEIVVEGNRSLLEEFIDEVKVGPRAARVSDVKITWQPHRHLYSRFDVR